MVIKGEQPRPRETLCPTCGGIMLTEKAEADARKWGNASYLKSLEPGQMSMSQRGSRGGNPKDGGYTGPPPIGR